MARAPSEQPKDLAYRPELVPVEMESDLLAVMNELRFDPIVIRGQAARRSWEHSIPPTKEQRYSITFRTLR